MATNQEIKDLLEKYMRIENEIKLLQEDKKELLSSYKDKIDPKAFASALRAAKISAKIRPQDKQQFDQALHVLETALSIEHVD